MRPKDKTLLAKLGLKPADDKDGLILNALHMLQGYALNRSQRIEETDALLATKVMIEECNNREPALLAAQLVHPIAIGADPGLVAETMNPRVAEILQGLYNIMAQDDGPGYDDEIARRVEEADPAVRHSLFALHAVILEDALLAHGDKPLSSSIAHEAELGDGRIAEITLSVREYFDDLSDTLAPLRRVAEKDTSEPRLADRFIKAFGEISARLAPENAPAFGAAFRFAAGLAPNDAEQPPAPGKGKPPGHGMLN